MTEKYDLLRLTQLSDMPVDALTQTCGGQSASDIPAVIPSFRAAPHESFRQFQWPGSARPACFFSCASNRQGALVACSPTILRNRKCKDVSVQLSALDLSVKSQVFGRPVGLLIHARRW